MGIVTNGEGKTVLIGRWNAEVCELPELGDGNKGGVEGSRWRKVQGGRLILKAGGVNKYG